MYSETALSFDFHQNCPFGLPMRLSSKISAGKFANQKSIFHYSLNGTETISVFRRRGSDQSLYPSAVWSGKTVPQFLLELTAREACLHVQRVGGTNFPHPPKHQLWEIVASLCLSWQNSFMTYREMFEQHQFMHLLSHCKTRFLIKDSTAFVPNTKVFMCFGQNSTTLLTSWLCVTRCLSGFLFLLRRWPGYFVSLTWVDGIFSFLWSMW